MPKLRYAFSCLVFASVTPILFAAPHINLVANAASNTFLQGPAEGSIIVIYGTGLGPSAISYSPTPFQTTTLSGTSVAVTVGSNTVNALMYYTSDTQVAALLPSNTPTGQANYTVTYNGQTSNGFTLGVARSWFGIYTLDSSGVGPAVVMYPDYSLVSAVKTDACGGPNTPCGAANPGDTLILWGTGLGPVAGNDATGTGLGQDMTNLPVNVWVGGVQAEVSYRGRSGCCIGDDQIVFTVPNNVPTGCAVPVAVQIGAANISNMPVMPIAAGSRNCTTSNPALANAETAIMAGPVSYGVISLQKNYNNNGALEDDASFQFGQITGVQGTEPSFVSWIDDPPPGTCIVYPPTNSGGSPPASAQKDLDAGSTFTIAGPSGSNTVKGRPGSFNATLDSSAKFLSPGAFTVTGTGGADVGAFSADFAFPAPIMLTSPGKNATVTRANGLTTTWTGGDPNGIVQIYLISASDNTFNYGVQANCFAPTSAGTFTIPPYVLNALPASNFAGFSITPTLPETTFTAPGLSVGFTQNISNAPWGHGFGQAGDNFILK